jgi:predicted enzyme related to lactoylglutathione lyase
LERAEAFYRAIGLEFARHSHGGGPEHLASEADGQVFEIYPASEDGASTSSVRIGFTVPSVDSAYEAALAVGGKSVSRPKDSPWGRRAVVADFDGHRIELTEENAATA